MAPGNADSDVEGRLRLIEARHPGRLDEAGRTVVREQLVEFQAILQAVRATPPRPDEEPVGPVRPRAGGAARP